MRKGPYVKEAQGDGGFKITRTHHMAEANAAVAEKGVAPSGVQPETLRRKSLRHNYRCAVTDGVLAYVSSGMVPPFISIMALSYGASGVGISLLNLLPSLINMLLFLPFASIAERSGSVKRMVISSGYLTRSAFLAMALVPFLPWPWKATALIALNALQAIPAVIYMIVWTDMMGGAFPQGEWGAVFSKRNAAANFASVVGTLLAGLLIDWLPGESGYIAIFAISGATGIMSIFALQRMKEVPGPQMKPRRISVFKRLSMPFRDRELGRSFTYFSLGLFLYNLGIYMAAPAFSLFYVKVLDLSKSTISLLITTGTLLVVVASPFWGRISRKYGNAIVFAYSTIWQALFPYFYYLSGKSLPMMFVWQAILGFGVAGYNLSLFNLGLEYVEESERKNGIAVTNTVIFSAAAIGSLIAGPLTEVYGVGNAMLASTLVRISGWASFLAVFQPYRAVVKVLSRFESKQIKNGD